MLLIEANSFMPLMFLKKISSFLFCAFILVFLVVLDCRAETIYYRNGRVFSGQVLYRKGNQVWVKTKLGAMGIPIDSINKIVNEDGTLSKYDYKSLSGAIQDYISKKDYAQALNQCALLLESFPEDSQLHYLRAVLSQKSGDLKLAEAEYKFLIEHEGADAKVLNNLGAIYAESGQEKQARDFFSEALKADPEFKEAHANLANMFMQQKDYSGAIAEYRKALNSDPDSSQIRYNLGTAYFKINDYSGAKSQWERVLYLDPQDEDAKRALEFLKAKGLAD